MQMADPDHVVLLVHGIRTHAAWAEMVANTLEAEPGVRVQPIKYGYFDVFKFLCPVFSRSAPIRKLIREYRDTRASYPQAKISAIAHSFGTYALTKALEEPDIQFHRVIFCGSIVKDDFRTAPFRAQLGREPILNDCGTHDFLPILAKSVTWGFGASGTFGFGTVGIRDRFNKFTHSGYFTREFVRDFWKPFLLAGTINPTEWETARTTPPYWHSLLSAFPLKTAVAAAGIAALLYGNVNDILGANTDAKLADEIYIGHWLGMTQIYSRFHFENTSWSPKSFLITGVKATMPSGKDVALSFEGITSCDGSVPQNVLIEAPARTTRNCDYSFIHYSPEFPKITNEINQYLVNAKENFQNPMPIRTIFSREILDSILNYANSHFEIEPGTWKMEINYSISGKVISKEYQFIVDKRTVDRLKGQMSYANTGLGVLMQWRYLAPDGSQPLQIVRPSEIAKD
jgi:hypothetical protein